MICGLLETHDMFVSCLPTCASQFTGWLVIWGVCRVHDMCLLPPVCLPTCACRLDTSIALQVEKFHADAEERRREKEAARIRREAAQAARCAHPCSLTVSLPAVLLQHCHSQHKVCTRRNYPAPIACCWFLSIPWLQSPGSTQASRQATTAAVLSCAACRCMPTELHTPASCDIRAGRPALC